MNKLEVRAQFAALAAQNEETIELDRGALLIAAEEYPSLEIETYRRRLEMIAAEARQAVGEERDPRSKLERLSNFLAGDLRFNGNREKYFDARNSFLNEVLDRRTGIPITLSVIYLEVARRIGLRFFGVGMPGHFLVKAIEDGQEYFLDPFHSGRLLIEQECRAMIDELYQGRMVFQPEFLRPVDKRQILSRMLQNLKGIYTGLLDFPKSLSAVERLLLLNPDQPAEIRDRGMIFYAMERYAEAITDLQDYLGRQPESEDAEQITEKINQARLRQARYN